MIDIPGYKIVRTLGMGGMACVYLAIQESFEREVALKVMNAALSEDPKFTARFLHEARVVSRLVHPNIVTVYDVGVQDNQHYLSMEYVPGLDLKHKRKFLTPPQSLQVIRDVAKALDYASKKGYVHRDVKPENIMLHDDDGRAVLMDFGIACIADTSSGMTQTGTAIGTPHYMSPEQAKGRPVDSRSDIYSLGVVLFLLLTGRVPYDADSAVAVGIKHVQEAIPRLPGNLLVLQPIINKVLAKNPDHRYQTGAELVAAIDAVTDEDIEAIQIATKHYNSQQAQRSAGDSESTAAGKRKTTRNRKAATSPDNTTRAAAALNTQITARTPGHEPQPDKPGPDAASPGLGDSPSGRQRAMERHTAGHSQNVPATGADDTAAPEDDVLAVAEEDRRDYVSDQQERRRWPWAVAASLALVLGGGIYFRAYLPPPMAGAADSFVDESAALGADIGNSLSVAFGLSPPDAAEIQRAAPGARSQSLSRESVAEAAPQPPEELPADSGGSPILSSPEQGALVDDARKPVGEGEAGEQGMGDTARSLRNELDSDLSVAPELAHMYRDVLSATPDDKRAEWGLRELLDYHYRHVREALEARDLEAAESYFTSLEASFPASGRVVKVDGDETYQRLRERFERVRQAQRNVDQGNRYLADDALTSPSGANALEAYRRALELDPGNPAADAGIKQVVERHAELAKAKLENGDWAGAAETANRGLSIDDDNEVLTGLVEDARARRERQDNVEQLLARAQRQLEAGNYVSPQGESAYDHYRSLQALDPDDNRATQGIAEVEKQLAYAIERHINRNQFDEAFDLLQIGRDIYRRSERLASLEEALERAMEAHFQASQPRIREILVSSERRDNFRQVQTTTLNVERTIYIGFSYENFGSQTSVVQAMLYDGSRSVQIAQVPVIVNDENGAKFFQIGRPVDGFAEGSYNIDLMLGEERLSTLSFRVERGQQASESSQAAVDASQTTASQ